MELLIEISKKKKPYTLNTLLLSVATWLVCVFLVSVPLHAEPFFYFDYIGENAGISNGNIEDITQDKNGYIWIATQNGLFKFDGSNSKQYLQDSQPGSLLDADIYALLVTQENQLWVATNTKGLALFDEQSETFRHITNDESDISIAHFRTRMLLEHNNFLWIVTDLGIEFKHQQSLISTRVPLIDDAGTEKLNYYPLSLVKYKDGLLAVVDGKLYFLAKNDTAFRRHKFSQFRPYAYSSESKHLAVFSAGDNEIFLQTIEGIYSLDEASKVIKREPYKHDGDSEGDLQITDIKTDVHGTRWLITRNYGMYYRFHDSEKYEKVSVGNSRNQLNTDLILSFFIDKDRNFWVGTDGVYVAKFRAPQDRFEFYSNYHESDITLHANSIWRVVEWNEKTYVASHKGLFELQSGAKKPTLKPVLVGPKYHFLFDMEVIDDVLVLLTRQGMYELQKNGVVTNVTRELLDRNEKTKDLEAGMIQVEQSDTHIFIGTFEGLIVIDRQSQATVLYNSEENNQYKLRDNWAVFLQYDKANDWIWVGTTSGMDVIPVGPSASDVTEVNTLLSEIKDAIHDVHFNSNEAWIATSLGLYRLTANKELILYDHFSEKNIRSIEIIDDIIWMSTSNGLIKTSKLDTNNYQYFVPEDGIYNTLNTEASSFYSEDKNTLYFGGSRGLAAFQPDKALDENEVLEPVLEGVYLFNQNPQVEIMHVLNTQGKVNYNENSLRFEFAYLDYKAPHRTRFQYKLEGFDLAWSELTKETSVPYTNLPSGEYSFFVRAFNSNNIMSSEKKLISFAITKPWWSSTLAYFLYSMLLLSLALYLANYFRSLEERKRSSQLQRKREEFISSYSEYSTLLASLSAYQTMTRLFLERLAALTGARSLQLSQSLNGEQLITFHGDDGAQLSPHKIEKNLQFGAHRADLILVGVESDTLLEQSGDINLLYQQMALAQDNLIERTKFKWNQYFDSRTSLYAQHSFATIVRDELNLQVKNSVPTVLLWNFDNSYFLDNNLIERIQLMKYGELIKENFGNHVIATYIEPDAALPGNDDKKAKFALYANLSSQLDSNEIKRKIKEMHRLYVQQKDMSVSSYGVFDVVEIHTKQKISEFIERLEK